MTPADRHALALGGWSAGLVALALLVSHVFGLRYVQAVVWPTDLYAFTQLPDAPVDVALVGSSRTTFGLAPTALDPCLSRASGRTIRSVNLARVYANMLTETILVDDLLWGDRRPEVVVVEVAPEILNARHHEHTYNMATSVDLERVPVCLASVRHPDDLVACARAPLRGVETVARFLSGTARDVDHLTWMMVHQRGGQFCFGSAVCETHNARFTRRLGGRWDARLDHVLPTVAAERFASWEIDRGPHHDALQALVADTAAADIDLVLLNMPVHALYQAEVPAAADAEFRQLLRDLDAAHPHVTVFDANTPQWRQRRAAFHDPDHLGAEGARTLSGELCGVVAPLLTAE